LIVGHGKRGPPERKRDACREVVVATIRIHGLSPSVCISKPPGMLPSDKSNGLVLPVDVHGADHLFSFFSLCSRLRNGQKLAMNVP
jgi:hypothetical protein